MKKELFQEMNERWKGYFDKLLNEGNTMSVFEDGVHIIIND